MNELKNLLERGAGAFEPPPAGWDRLLRRASRRRTVRRLTAMVVASAVASAGIGLVLIAFRRSEPPQPASVGENGRIAFSTGGPNGGVYLMDADGTGVERLTSDPGDSEPAWSPDGSRIAFVRFHGGKSDIYVMNSDGTDVTRLTTDGADSAPAWSPDGSEIAFAREVPGNQDIYVMDPDGSNVDRLTDDPALEYAPAWSPDGMRIAFSAYASPPGPVHIYSMLANGTSRIQLTDSELDDASPAWSPDGASVAFVRDSRSIYVVGRDGGGLRKVVDPQGLTGGLGLTFYPTWSPDGTEIAFQSGPDGSDQRIYMVNVDGSGLHEVGSRKGSDPSWQPVLVPSTSAAPPISPTATPSPATVEPGTPFDVAFGDGSTWALTCDSGCSGDRRESVGSVLRIDPASGEVLASVSLSNPSRIAVGEGGVWVISFWDGTLTRIDPATSQVVATIKLELPFAVGDGPGARDFLPYDVAVGEASVWVDTARGVLAKIDPVTNQLQDMIRLPAESAEDVTVGEGAVWVAMNLLGVYGIDPGTDQVTARIAVNDAPDRRLSVGQVVAGGGSVWVQGAWARKTTDREGHEVYVLVSDAAIARIDPSTDQSVALIPVGDSPRLMAFDDGALWLWSNGSSLARIDPITGIETATVDAPAGGHFIAVGEGAGWAAMPDGSLARVTLPTG